MRVEHIPDVTPRFVSRETTTRQEYCTYISKLENERSCWESRIRVCQEREFMYKKMVNDMAAFLMATFQSGHETVSENAAKAGELIEAMQACMRRLEA